MSKNQKKIVKEIEGWEQIRQKGKLRFIVENALKYFSVYICGFLFVDLQFKIGITKWDLLMKEILSSLNEYIFVSLIIAVSFVLMKWDEQEKLYYEKTRNAEALKSKKGFLSKIPIQLFHVIMFIGFLIYCFSLLILFKTELEPSIISNLVIAYNSSRIVVMLASSIIAIKTGQAKWFIVGALAYIMPPLKSGYFIAK